MIWLLIAVVPHLICMVLLGIGLLPERTGVACPVGALALAIGVLDALWIPSGFVADERGLRRTAGSASADRQMAPGPPRPMLLMS